MRRSRWMIVVAAVAISVAACSSDDDDGGSSPFGLDDASTAEDGSTDSADDGDTGSSEGSSGQLDRDPSAAAGETEGGIPYPAEGLDVLADAGIEIGGQRQLHYPVDRFDEIVAFYDEYVDGLGGESGRSEIAGTITWQVFGDDGTLAIISVEPDFETMLGGEPVTVTFVLLVDGG